MQSTKGLPLFFSKGLQVYFVPPVLGVPRKGTVTACEQQNETKAWIAISTLDSLDKAQPLVGHYCIARTEDIPLLQHADPYSFLVGYKVFDNTHNIIGRVSAVEPNPAHPLLVINPKTATSQTSILRIPFVEDFIVEQNDTEQLLRVSLPDGLLEI